MKNTRLIFSQGIDPFSNKRDVLELPVRTCPFDDVIIKWNDSVSTEALKYLVESNVNVVMLHKPGKLYAYFHQKSGHEPIVLQNEHRAFR